jgi:heterodisulfide reductase subunit A
MKEAPVKYDALIIGSGIAGMESALKLGDMGYQVLLVEKEPSIGGKMILLSKVFPTLDCASCISTPKMGATLHHPNVTVLTHTEVEAIRRRADGSFTAEILKKPRYVDEAACTGCRQCEMSCTVAVPDQFNDDLVSRRAAFIAFPQAVPKKAVIERAGSSPCSFTCPAGIKAHGYVALARSEKFEQAFDLVLEATPLVGSLGRACYAPCEDECTRGQLEGPVPIRRIKRFIADRHYEAGSDPKATAGTATGKKVAVVGSGPAGVTAAWQLALAGHQVVVFEAAAKAGGMLRLSIPAYRLPSEVVDDDLSNLGKLGVEIRTGVRVTDPDELRRQGFDAICMATGTHGSVSLRVPGEEQSDVIPALGFLARAKLGEATALTGRKVVVVGGGNVAVDAARTALRLGAASVRMVSLESREQMPAHGSELDETLAEGVGVENSWGVVEVLGGNGSVTGLALRRCTSVFDDDMRFNPTFDDSVTTTMDADLVITAIGMFADTADFGLATNRNRTLTVDPVTLQTSASDVFAAGDTVTGPSMITKAVGHGRRAAFMIDRWLRGEPLDGAEFDRRMPMVPQEDVLARQKSHSRRDPLPQHVLASAPTDFTELEPAMTAQEISSATSRCLDCGVCSECHSCVDACVADAINLDMVEERVTTDIGTVIVSTGFNLFPADAKPQYGYGRYANVITGLQMDRLLAPTRPYTTVQRPSDGKIPERIAYVMCTGSRDATVGNPLCSRICCMYSIKQNQLIMGALPLADISVHNIDIRAVGKGYDPFYTQAEAMGTEFIKGRVARITETDNGNLLLTHEDTENGGGVVTTEYDLVVLAVGVQPRMDPYGLFPDQTLNADEYLYVAETDEDLDPGRTNIEGVFVAGTASGAKDIPESILHAGSAVAQAAAYLEGTEVPA